MTLVASDRSSVIIKIRLNGEKTMTTVEIELPDQLAIDAQRAGLLSPETISQLLRERLRMQGVDELFAAMDRMAAVNQPAPMSPEEVAKEMAAMRAERRTKPAR
jgi:hypothetical protein